MNIYKPSNNLQPVIDTYWTVKSKENTFSRILPDGFVDIIFECDKETLFPIKKSIRISGMMTSYRNVMSTKNTITYGIRIKAGLFNSFTNFPLSDIKNTTINASEVIPSFTKKILEQKNVFQTDCSVINSLESILTSELNANRANSNQLIPTVCKAIKNQYQNIDLLLIAKEHHISLRQLERRFKHHVGVTMKEYHSIVRFNNTMESIMKNPTKSLLNTAFDNGYFDHSHLTKEINKMSGKNPSEF